MYDSLAGILTEDEEGYHFQYDDNYVKTESAEPISITMPITKEGSTSKILFPFFDGLIPEGWLLDITAKSWKIDIRDRMSILLATCQDCIGAVSIVELKENEND